MGEGRHNICEHIQQTMLAVCAGNGGWCLGIRGYMRKTRCNLRMYSNENCACSMLNWFLYQCLFLTSMGWLDLLFGSVVLGMWVGRMPWLLLSAPHSGAGKSKSQRKVRCPQIRFADMLKGGWAPGIISKERFCIYEHKQSDWLFGEWLGEEHLLSLGWVSVVGRSGFTGMLREFRKGQGIGG